MKRQLILFLMTLITFISYAYDFEVDGIYYNRNYDWSSAEPKYDGTVSVTKGNYGYSGDIVIPDVVNYDGVEYKVTGIEQYYFDMSYWNNNLFGDIKSIIIGNNITYLQPYTFANCKQLTTVVLPNNLKHIGEYAFQGCTNLMSIKLPESLENIENCAFCECTGLVSITIPNSIKKLGNSVFVSCSSLSSVNVPTSITKLSDGLFNGCGLKDIEIPSNIEEIGDGCFGKTKIKEIVIPNTVKKMGIGVFSSCYELESVTLPDGLDEIAQSMFSNSHISIVNIPNSVKKICSNAFWACGNLKSITIPNSVIFIEEEAFSHSGLISIELPEGIESINGKVFWECCDLKKVRIPKNVKTIYANAFNTDIHSVDIEDIYIYAETPPTLYDGAFYQYTANLYVPDGKISDYKNANNWKKFNNIQEINGTTQKYFISAKYDYGGSVELNEETIVSDNVKDFTEGSAVIIKITPLENYVIRSIVLSGEDITDKLNNNEYTIDNINKDLSLVVSFKELRENYNASLSRDAKNGTITINDEVLSRYTSIPVRTGSDATLKIIPDPGYDIAAVTVNGESILGELKDGVYVIKAIDDDCVIYVVFTEKLKHQFLIVTHNDPGKVFLNGAEIPYNKTWGFPKGENVTIKVVPDDGFRLKYASLTIGWGSPIDITYDINEDGEYTIEEINENYSVYVEFENNPYYIHIIGATGTVISIPVRGGERQEVRLPVQSNRNVSKITYNGEDITSQIRKDGTFFTPVINEEVSMEILYEGERPAGDMNNDGVVDAADVVQIVNIIMSK